MREFILGIIVDILRHVPIEISERRGVRTIAAAAGDFAILDAPELIVLQPKIALDLFDGRQESQDRDIALGRP